MWSTDRSGPIVIIKFNVAVVYGTCHATDCTHASYQAGNISPVKEKLFWHSLLSRGDRGAWPGEYI